MMTSWRSWPCARRRGGPRSGRAPKARMPALPRTARRVPRMTMILHPSGFLPRPLHLPSVLACHSFFTGTKSSALSLRPISSPTLSSSFCCARCLCRTGKQGRRLPLSVARACRRPGTARQHVCIMPANEPTPVAMGRPAALQLPNMAVSFPTGPDSLAQRPASAGNSMRLAVCAAVPACPAHLHASPWPCRPPCQAVLAQCCRLLVQTSREPVARLVALMLVAVAPSADTVA